MAKLFSPFLLSIIFVHDLSAIAPGANRGRRRDLGPKAQAANPAANLAESCVKMRDLRMKLGTPLVAGFKVIPSNFPVTVNTIP